MTSLTLTPGDATLEDLRSLYEQDLALILDSNCKEKVEKAANVVANAAAGDKPVYGVNTGFGKLAQVRIAPDKTTALQRNLILSHACGVGDDLPTSVVRLVMVLKLLSLGRGASGVRWEVINIIEQMLKHGVTPSIPGQGSVGASGDLAPLAHFAAVMMGEGEAYYKGERLSGASAMLKAGVRPLVFMAKEGLALINGTQVSTALALANLFETHKLFCSALITGALSTDAAMGSSAPFRPQIHELRGHQGQIDSATALRELMSGSEIRESHRDNDERVQDPYCIRCQPQVMGACLDLMRSVAKTLEIEANAVTDNPLILVHDDSIVSGGNFHAEPVAFAADQLALAIAEIGSITERRIAMLVDPALNFGLPAFLTPEPGVNSGFMVAEITAAALYSENKQKAAPCSVDSTPTSANQEDHVSMATHAARRLFEMNANLTNIISIEWLIAAQGIELRTPLKTNQILHSAIELLRSRVPSLQQDRYMSPDIKTASKLVSRGSLCKTVDSVHLPLLQ